jgi:hypothetical protein
MKKDDGKQEKRKMNEKKKGWLKGGRRNNSRGDRVGQEEGAKKD